MDVPPEPGARLSQPQQRADGDSAGKSDNVRASGLAAAGTAALRSGWLWAFNALLLVVGVIFWQKLQWKKISDTPNGIVWQRNYTTHTDRNRDGRVDEEVIRLPNGDAAIRRDTDLDGWFDLRYAERRGLAMRPEQIRDEAPRH
ncbi:MAG: hypothetical protein RL514_3636 [Verrucomicrobiota bacterium]|jgi:hypothetical protein